MAEVAEAPLKRKLESSSEAAECKKPRDSVPDAVEPAVPNLQEAPAQTNGKHNLDGQVNPFGETVSIEAHETTSKDDRDSLFRLPEQAPCSSSLPFDEPQTVEQAEVLEDEHDDGGEISELDTENDSEDDDEDEDEDAGSDEDEDDSDDDCDNEEEEEPMLTSTNSSLQAESALKGKGKETIEDVKGKGILLLDKGKGKAIAEDESGPVSDEDDAGYLSEDPLEEVDLNNILPTRTRRRTSTHQYDFVDQGDDNDDDDDDASDA